MNNTIAKQRVIVGVACATFALLLFGFVIVAKPTLGQPTTSTSTSVAASCVTPFHFYAYDDGTPEGSFGPPVESAEVNVVRAEAHTRRANDVLLLATNIANWNGEAMTPDSLRAQAQAFIENPKGWCDALTLLELGESTCTASIATMGGHYKTLGMQRGASADVTPWVYKADPDRPSFQVLRFDCAGGKQINLKLDCGFQPVAQEFPGLPGPPTGPPPTSPPVTRPPANSTVPPHVTFPPSVTTVPPTTHGGKNPDDGINHNPGACGLGDCGPRPVNPTPPPPESVVPTATVAPPPVTPPPTVTVVQQPTVTSTIVSPPTAPG